jgi:hypothetical protein
MAYLCPHQCDGKTEYGYCRYTWCANPLHSNFGTAQQGQGVQKRIITNADRIRAMTDEELAYEILSWFNWLNAVEWDDKRIIEWLKQEVSTNG